MGKQGVFTPLLIGFFPFPKGGVSLASRGFSPLFVGAFFFPPILVVAPPVVEGFLGPVVSSTGSPRVGWVLRITSPF